MGCPVKHKDFSRARLCGNDIWVFRLIASTINFAFMYNLLRNFYMCLAVCSMTTDLYESIYLSDIIHSEYKKGPSSVIYHWCDRRIFAYRRPLRRWGSVQMQSGGNLVLRRWCVCPRVIAARNSSCRVV